jgi:hypothetical protein
MGIPTVTVTREGFSRVVTNAFTGEKFPAEASQVVYPVDMFMPASDLTPIEEKMDELIAGLTSWEPGIKRRGVVSPPPLVVEGDNYEEAFLETNRLFLKNMWSEGLPIVPPTKERVSWILTGTDVSPDTIIARILPRGGIATAEMIAVNLAMAGGRPEYMPVLIGAVEAMNSHQFEHHRMNSTTCAVYPVMIINGPIAQQVRLGSGYGCLGPDPLHPAGASIGRAIRLLLQGAGGAVPEIGTMSIYGGPARYTNIVFAEDEVGLPSEWRSLCVEQGFQSGKNIVTAYAVSSTTNIPGGEVGDETSALATLNRAAGVIGTPNGNYWVYPYNPEGAAGIFLMARGTARGLSRVGWTKEEVKRYLWENSKVPSSRLGPFFPTWWIPREQIMQDPMPVSVSPDGIRIVVAGGDQSGHMMWLQVGCCPQQLSSVEIRLPNSWEELLRRAEADMGPIPAMRD